MRRLRRLAAVAWLIAAAGTGVPGCADRARHAPAPAALSRLAVGGLSEPARIVTDCWGIPHLRAASLPDLYLAWGFVTARDRLWQLEVTRRAARGDLSEWFGNRALTDDGGAQLFRLRERAEAIWAREARDPRVAEPLRAYAAGINAYLSLCRRGARPWPPEFLRLGRRPADWRPADSVLLLLAQGLLLDLDLPEIGEARLLREHGRGWIERRRRFEGEDVYATIPDRAALRLYGGDRGPAADRAAASIATPPLPRPGKGWETEAARSLGTWGAPEAGDQARRASNVFAVGAALGAGGKPALANDPHLTLRAPGALYVVHLSAPGVDAAGATVPGLPAIVSGRSRVAAWGITALSADVIDVYADSLSADGRRTWWRGQWVPIRSAAFTMRYRVLGLIPVPLFGRSRRYTPHGPVLVLDRRRRVALSARWAGEDSSVTLSGILGIERSSGAAEIAERFRRLVTPCLNLVAADTAGVVIYQAAGAVPDRGFAPGYGPLPDDGAHEWRGLIPADRMPRWRLGPSDFVVNANNLPVGSAYPIPWPRFDRPHDRARRIAQRLAGARTIGLPLLADIQNDVTSLGAERLLPRLLRCADSAASALPPRARAALDTLRAWDFRALRGRVAPTLFRGWAGALARRSDLEGLPELTAAALDGRAPEALPAPGGQAAERPATAAAAALELALEELTGRLGPNLSRWQWERAHQAVFAHALAWKDSTFEPPPVPADGDNSTPCVGASRLPWSVRFTHGPAFRHVVDLAVADSSLAVIPPGNSGDPASGHARDLLRRWADHDYVPLLLSWTRIEAARETEITLEPRPR